ncbi:EamA family transporter [Leucobacter weissii]|uniref:EamA family transporter n=1 Tax=Leucobacter weissii TaxID=1983706 RepID=A0A939MPY4_9MICO|nr:EamA family transporter [Leucobacter weissii]MBO1902466.1 EamA family transporter [Leucobacter weissii]
MWAILAVIFAALCFSTTGTAQALAGVDASPTAVGAARILLGGGILGIVALIHGRRAAPTDAGAARARIEGSVVPPQALAPRSWLAALLGAAGVVAYQPLFFLGTQQNGVAIGTVVALGSAPILTGLLELVVRRRRPAARWLAATAIALLGVVLVSGMLGGVLGGDATIHAAGLLASIGAGGSYAVYTIAGKSLIDQGWSSSRAMGIVFGLAALISAPVLAVAGAGWILTPRGALLVLWLGLVTTAFAYLLFGWGLARLRATTVSTLTLAEPLGATLLGLLVLHEQLTALAALGLVVIAAGLLMLALPSRRAERRPAPNSLESDERSRDGAPRAAAS